MAKKTVLVVTGALFVFCFISTFSFRVSAQGKPLAPASVTDENTVILPVGSYIGLDCVNSVDLGTIIGFGAAIKNINCSVATNNITGYQIDFDSNDLTANTNKFTALGNTPTVLNQTQVAQWGVNLTLGATADNTGWFGTGTLSSATGPTPATGTIYTYRVGASAGSGVSLPADSYVGTLTITATVI